MSIISYPTPLYQNVDIQTGYYTPQRFQISAISLGTTTTVTTSVDHDYAIGQLVRLIIPPDYGARQLHEQQGYVLSLPADDQVEIQINSTNANAFRPTPYEATITNATQAARCVLTANNFLASGNVTIADVGGMTELNGTGIPIFSSNTTTITLNLNSSTFTAYTTGGTVTLEKQNIQYPQILAVGDVNSGQTSSTGNTNVLTYISGSFRNISP